MWPWIVVSVVCVWMMCGIGAHSAMKPKGKKESLLIIAMGPISALAILTMGSRNGDA